MTVADELKARIRFILEHDAAAVDHETTVLMGAILQYARSVGNLDMEMAGQLKNKLENLFNDLNAIDRVLSDTRFQLERTAELL
jgi:DNA-directed RNA polymerase subunit F